MDEYDFRFVYFYVLSFGVLVKKKKSSSNVLLFNHIYVWSKAMYMCFLSSYNEKLDI